MDLPACLSQLLEMTIPANDRIHHITALHASTGGTIEPAFAAQKIRAKITNHEPATPGAIRFVGKAQKLNPTPVLLCLSLQCVRGCHCHSCLFVSNVCIDYV